jgi:hypothetical protein
MRAQESFGQRAGLCALPGRAHREYARRIALGAESAARVAQRMLLKRGERAIWIAGCELALRLRQQSAFGGE